MFAVIDADRLHVAGDAGVADLVVKRPTLGMGGQGERSGGEQRGGGDRGCAYEGGWHSGDLQDTASEWWTTPYGDGLPAGCSALATSQRVPNGDHRPLGEVRGGR